MIEILSNLSLFLGFVIQGAAQIILVILAVFGIVYFVDKHTPASACHGNCNQGRNCTCKEKKDGI